MSLNDMFDDDDDGYQIKFAVINTKTVGTVCLFEENNGR